MATFLAFTTLDAKAGKEYVSAHTDQIAASGGRLDAQMSDVGTIFRLSLPDSMAGVHADTVLPDYNWMQVEGQTVLRQNETVDIDALEGNAEGSGN